MASMMHRPQFHKARDGQRKVSPPGPTYMSNDQIGTCLRCCDIESEHCLRFSRMLAERPAMG